MSASSTGGGEGCNWVLCPSEGRCVHRLPRPGEGGEVQQGPSGDVAPWRLARAAAWPQEGLGGGHIAHGGRPSTAPRHTRGRGWDRAGHRHALTR